MNFESWYSVPWLTFVFSRYLWVFSLTLFFFNLILRTTCLLRENSVISIISPFSLSLSFLSFFSFSLIFGCCFSQQTFHTIDWVSWMTKRITGCTKVVSVPSATWLSPHSSTSTITHENCSGMLFIARDDIVYIWYLPWLHPVIGRIAPGEAEKEKSRLAYTPTQLHRGRVKSRNKIQKQGGKCSWFQVPVTAENQMENPTSKRNPRQQSRRSRLSIC